MYKMILYISKNRSRRKGFEDFIHKEMINIWGDRYAHPDLNIPQCIQCIETSHDTSQICTIFMSTLKKSSAKILKLTSKRVET